MRKKFLAGAAVLALLMSSPQAKADDEIVIFGGEFEEESTAPAPKKVEKPAPVKELPPPPIEKPAPVEPEIIEPSPEKPAPVQPEKSEPPVEKPEKIEPQTPPQQPVAAPEEEDDWGDTLIFDDLGKKSQATQPTEEPTPAPIEQPTFEPPPAPIPSPIVEPPIEIDRPFAQPIGISGGQDEPVVILPQSEPTTYDKPTPRSYSTNTNVTTQKNLKKLKPRFVKLAVDDTYNYYLDKTSVQWKKMPYSSSEYIADVWIRMVERTPAPLDNDMAAYGAENFSAEVLSAQEQGYQYAPEDLNVLRSQSYILEHYYLRPKTHQIQFLCELEVFGRPQNTINERTYDYKNWENLVPGSIESVIYATVLKTIGTKKASDKGHMTFIDMLEEYGRISLR